jgi:N-acyl-D-aspartate/D-glutamate deacylase
MGERAVGEEASPEELAQMQELLRESIRQGGLGFSSSVAPTHNDGDGNPVPSRHASRDELLALARVLRDLPGTVLEFLPGISVFSDEQKQLMTDLSLAANRPLNWNVLAPTAASADVTAAQLSASDFAAERGATVVALTVPQPMTVRINLLSGFVFDALPGWDPLFRLPVPERMERLRDPAFRKQLDDGANSEAAGLLRGLARWEIMSVDQVASEENAPFRGRNIGELAQEQGKTPFDCMIDLALTDGLRTSFMPMTMGNDDASWELRAKVWKDPRAVIGASDAGAHLDMIDTFAFSTQVLGNIRERNLIPLEEAVQQLSDVPARLYGLRERGRLQQDWHADVVVFDPETVKTGETYTRDDLPGGAGRLYADAEGIHNVLVNGVEIVRDGKATGALSGQQIHPGRDTDTVEVPGGRRAQ